MAYPIDSNDLFGVTNTAMEYKKGKGEKLFVCDGITLLPLGKKWIALARACMGCTNNEFLPGGSNHLTNEELELCDVVCSHLFSDGFQEVFRSD